MGWESGPRQAARGRAPLPGPGARATVAAVSGRRHQLIDCPWPELGAPEELPPPTVEELSGRIAAARAAMERQRLTHLIVYADREHFANLAWLTHFDPRFEEALLVLRLEGAPLLLVGNECLARVPVSPLHGRALLRAERYQPLSLLDQPRGESRLLSDILAGEGIVPGAAVGCVGWKYFSEAEHPGARHAIELPAFVVDALRELCGRERVVNATALFMSADGGLRSRCSPWEIAFLEGSNALASEAARRILRGLREGMTDHEATALAGYDGRPLSCHMGVKGGDRRRVALASPCGSALLRGTPVSFNVAYWGSNICRAGWMAEEASDLPPAARDYVEAFAGPYFEAMAAWLGRLRIGASGGELAELIERMLPFQRFAISLNPGHLVHLDEWLSSPISAGSTVALRSGMAFQSDVIPSSPVYGSVRMEEGLVLADAPLRQALAAQYPGCHARCLARRRFMAEALGIDLPEESLPLSNLPALVPPFFLRPERVLALRP